MWEVVNQTRFRADRAFVRDREGGEVWIVVVRATFVIGPDGSVAVAASQEDVCRTPVYFGDPGKSQLQYDSDFVPMKNGTDVILHACAYAPHQLPASSVDVGAEVGPMSKRLRIFGDRVWIRGRSDLEPGSAEPFLSLPITYERAWGGALLDKEGRDPYNPVGVGCDASHGSAVPNVEELPNSIKSARHSGPPAGFGPIPSHWQPRLRFAGTYDDFWRKARQPLVPDDFNEAFYQCAPAGQQVTGFLRGGEEVVLQNLSPEGMLRFTLPRIPLGFRTRIGGTVTHHQGKIHTVIIEPDKRKLVVVWQTALPCHHTAYTLKETVVIEKARRKQQDGPATGSFNEQTDTAG